MNSEQIETSNKLLQGIQFLIAEAERNRISKVAQILKSCAQEIVTVIETHRLPHHH